MTIDIEIKQRPANSTYPKVAVQWLNQALCIYQRLCLVDSEALLNRQLLVAAKRYLQVAGQASADIQHHDKKQFDISTRDN